MHDCSHVHHRCSSRQVLLIMVLVGGFMFVEFFAGLYSGSLALVADSGHMLSDLAALMLTWIALKVSRRVPSRHLSYGWHRVQMLVAFANGLTMVGVAGWVVLEAIRRLFSPIALHGWTVLVVAALGGLINVCAYLLLHRDENFAVRSATLHVLWDMIGSFGTVAASVLILLTGKHWIDPLLSIVLSCLLLKSTLRILRDAGFVLMQGTPKHIDVDEIVRDLTENVPNVVNVHHVHVWSLTHDRVVLTLHVLLKESGGHEETLRSIKERLREEHGLYHATVQLEVGGCVDASEPGRYGCEGH